MSEYLVLCDSARGASSPPECVWGRLSLGGLVAARVRCAVRSCAKEGCQLRKNQAWFQLLLPFQRVASIERFAGICGVGWGCVWCAYSCLKVAGLVGSPVFCEPSAPSGCQPEHYTTTRPSSRGGLCCVKSVPKGVFTWCAWGSCPSEFGRVWGLSSAWCACLPQESDS